VSVFLLAVFRGSFHIILYCYVLPVYRHLPTTESTSDNKDVPSSPSLAKLLKTDTANAVVTRQQPFDSGGLLDGGRDSWGSISKMLHQRYNSSSSGDATGETGDTQITLRCVGTEGSYICIMYRSSANQRDKKICRVLCGILLKLQTNSVISCTYRIICVRRRFQVNSWRECVSMGGRGVRCRVLLNIPRHRGIITQPNV